MLSCSQRELHWQYSFSASSGSSNPYAASHIDVDVGHHIHKNSGGDELSDNGVEIYKNNGLANHISSNYHFSEVTPTFAEPSNLNTQNVVGSQLTQNYFDSLNLNAASSK